MVQDFTGAHIPGFIPSSAAVGEDSGSVWGGTHAWQSRSRGARPDCAALPAHTHPPTRAVPWAHVCDTPAGRAGDAPESGGCTPRPSTGLFRVSHQVPPIPALRVCAGRDGAAGTRLLRPRPRPSAARRRQSIPLFTQT